MLSRLAISVKLVRSIAVVVASRCYGEHQMNLYNVDEHDDL
jgi:hypothetical protein